jgi:acetyl-CoA carboxylase, biotin carboxylase subunit
MAIGRILIANRGEIAVRIIRTCEELGIETVLAVSEADRESLGAKLATRAVCIGPAHSSQSYLNIGAVIEAAVRTGCDAIHPGYGFLSENAKLTDACADNKIIFIGPTADNLRAVGDKLEARRHAEAAGVPMVPGGSIATLDDARAMAAKTGYPALVKAVAGGGGRGMKLVSEPKMLEDQINLAMSEAAAAFGDGRVYLERYITSGRHIEVQILGDGRNVIHIGERDCSVQRRYQKVIEEAPAPGLSKDLRDAVHSAALKYARHLNYKSLGTVEFLVDCDRNEFYFLEMNARIQVEHPVTEAISGLDLVAQQIRIANGEDLGLAQSDIKLAGHCVECRINAETITADFRPAPGRVSFAWFASTAGTRVDTHIQTGSMIPPFYDSMIAKAIAWGPTRNEALTRMTALLATARIDGVDTNIALHQAIIADSAFVRGGVDTNYLGQLLQSSPFGVQA